MERGLLTRELLERLPEISEDRLRGAIRRGHLHPRRLSNGLFVWPPEAVEKAMEHFGVGSETVDGQ